MAKLNSPAIELAAAVSAATLTTSRRLSRNFSYYRSTKSDEVPFYSRQSLLSVCDSLRMDMFGLQNLFLDDSEPPTPFMVTIAGNIHDAFENIHRNLLFYSAEYIEEIIPVIDRERAYWRQFTNHTFYENGISRHIDSHSIPAISLIKEKLLTFPERPENTL